MLKSQTYINILDYLKTKKIQNSTNRRDGMITLENENWNRDGSNLNENNSGDTIAPKKY